MFCPVCEAQVPEFLPQGNRQNARCPNCRSLERHRYIWLLLAERTPLLDGQPKRVLDFGPAPCLRARIAMTGQLEYLTADLFSERGDLPWDVRAIPEADASFDGIICSHVLEHVDKDRQAIGELYRVLKPGGWGLIAVPVTVDVTFEDPTATSDEDRVRLYGVKDHVRRYGWDFPERLTDAGFELTTPDPAAFVPGIYRRLSNLSPRGIWLVRKPL